MIAASVSDPGDQARFTGVSTPGASTRRPRCWPREPTTSRRRALSGRRFYGWHQPPVAVRFGPDALAIATLSVDSVSRRGTGGRGGSGPFVDSCRMVNALISNASPGAIWIP